MTVPYALADVLQGELIPQYGFKNGENIFTVLEILQILSKGNLFGVSVRTACLPASDITGNGFGIEFSINGVNEFV